MGKLGWPVYPALVDPSSAPHYLVASRCTNRSDTPHAAAIWFRRPTGRRVLSVPAVVDAVAGASVDPQLEYALGDSAVVPELPSLTRSRRVWTRARISALWSRNHVSNVSVPSAVT